MIRVARNVRVTSAGQQTRPVGGPIYGFRLIPQPFPIGDTVPPAGELPGEFPARVEVRDARGMAHVLEVLDAGWVDLGVPCRSLQILAPTPRRWGPTAEWYTVQTSAAAGARVPDSPPPAWRGTIHQPLGGYGAGLATAQLRARRFRELVVSVANYDAAPVNVTAREFDSADAQSSSGALITTFVTAGLAIPAGETRLLVWAPGAALEVGLIAAFPRSPPPFVAIEVNFAVGGMIVAHGAL